MFGNVVGSWMQFGTEHVGFRAPESRGSYGVGHEGEKWSWEVLYAPFPTFLGLRFRGCGLDLGT